MMTKTINIQYHKTKIGDLIIGDFQGKVCLLDYRFRRMRTTIDKRIQEGIGASFLEQNNDILEETKEQVDQYLKGVRKTFDIPILTVGTDFQKQTWEGLQKIHYGETISYATLAKRISNPKAVRAVASANGANAIALIIPCHRVIESDGGFGGYAGSVAIKKRLLYMERNTLW